MIGVANRKMRIAIAGGGPSGLTLAAILAREAPSAAFDITVFERGTRDRDQGAGWDIIGGAQAALSRAGVKPEVYQRPGSDTMRFYKVGCDKPLSVLRMPPVLERLGLTKAQIGLDEINPETERGKIINSLSSSTTIQYETCISELKQDHSDGCLELIGRDGTSYGKFDVIVDASGVSSSLRQARFTTEADSYYTGTCLVMSVIDASEKTIEPVIAGQLGEGTLMNYGPTADGKGTVELMLQRFGAENSKTTLGMMVNTNDPKDLVKELEFQGIWGLTSDPAALKRVKDYARKRLSAFPEEYQAMYDHILGAYVSQVKMHPSYADAMKSTVSGSDKLPFIGIGDALHALPPWSGMSGNYSLMDAADLATSLISLQKTEWTNLSIAEVLRGHEKDFMQRTDERREDSARTPDRKDYLSITPIEEFDLVGRVTNMAFSWKDMKSVAIQSFLRFITFLNRFDNYGIIRR